MAHIVALNQATNVDENTTKKTFISYRRLVNEILRKADEIENDEVVKEISAFGGGFELTIVKKKIYTPKLKDK